MKFTQRLDCSWWAALIIIVAASACRRESPSDLMFTKLSTDDSGVNFENHLTSDAEFNIIQYLYFYNGAGVALGDINNDGLTDLYFSSNQETNKLYLNKGGLQFEDITAKANVPGAGNWKTGVTMADVNGDGLLDIYSCGVGGYKKFDGSNKLYINRGDLTFADSTAAYGLDFQGFSSQATFFDYDNDGDLDLFLVNHAVHTVRSIGPAMMRFQSDARSGDKLYRNEQIPSGKTYFKEVTSSAGIYSSAIGYGLGVAVSDLNHDGFMDIYVSNDFHENDYLYINQKNGKFIERLVDFVPHSSRFSMGVDIADINNDGWTDIFSLDMLPRDEGVIKTTAGEDAYDIFEHKLKFGYHYQFARNALQLNRGVDRNGDLMFSDIAPLAGVEATDWSWGPVMADFDNDGLNDLFVANGIAGRPNDLDYINYISSDSAQRYLADEVLIAKMPSGAVPNYFFRNRGDLRFDDVSAAWTGTESTLSNGAASADLDNDGDLDLVVNNLNAKATIFRNNHDPKVGAYLKVNLIGSRYNSKGVGAIVNVRMGGKTFTREQVPTRGWLSAGDNIIHFGLPAAEQIDSVSVRWPDGKGQLLINTTPNQTVVLKYADASLSGFEFQVHSSEGKLDNNVVGSRTEVAKESKNAGAATGQTGSKSLLFESLPDLAESHRENSFVAFNQERLIPTSVSMDGPDAATADVNGDGLADLYICGGKGQPGLLYLQRSNNEFVRKHVLAFEKDSLAEDVAAVFFDADKNGTADLLVASGGQEPATSGSLRPRLYLNNGHGEFNRSASIPEVDINASCIRASDFDRDGDEDVFIGSNVVPGHYGEHTSPVLWRNLGKGAFEDATNLLPEILRDSAGMITDALWLDINGDSLLDLIVLGDWMPVTVILQDANGKFIDATRRFGLEKSYGWWRSLAAADFDMDGDIDLVAGNFGINSRMRADTNHPLKLYLSDIDNNGSMDPIIEYSNQGIAHPFISRDQLVKQVPSLKKKYISYSNYRNVKIDDILSEKKSTNVKKVFAMETSYFENNNGRLIIKPLPAICQISSVDGMAVLDINGDGTMDIVMAGNTDAVQPDIGRTDASYGAVLLGDGHGGFTSLEPGTSGFVARGQARCLMPVTGSKGEVLLVVSRNQARPLLYRLPRAKMSNR